MKAIHRPHHVSLLLIGLLAALAGCGSNTPAGADACFGFIDAAAGVAGWTTSAVHDGATTVMPIETNCRVLPTMLRAEEGGEDPGALTVAIELPCFPTTPENVPVSQTWGFDFISPDLGERAGWQGIAGLSFAVRSKVPLYFEPVITYRSGEETKSTAVNDETGKPGFFSYIDADVGSWKTIRSAFTLPDGARLEQVKVRVYGEPKATAVPEASVNLDRICPIAR